MSSEEDIFDFLAQPDNLPVALDVANYIDRLARNLHRRFWSNFNPMLNQRLIESDYATSWKYHPHPARSYRRGWGKSFIRPTKPEDEKVPRLQTSFGQATADNDFRFFWGVRWVIKAQKLDHPGITTLKGELLTRKMTIVEDNWPGWGWYKYSPYDPDFIIKMYNEPGTLVTDIVDDVWEMFIGFRPMLDEINEALRQV